MKLAKLTKYTVETDNATPGHIFVSPDAVTAIYRTCDTGPTRVDLGPKSSFFVSETEYEVYDALQYVEDEAK